jgi:hypothetical protein
MSHKSGQLSDSESDASRQSHSEGEQHSSAEGSNADESSSEESESDEEIDEQESQAALVKRLMSMNLPPLELAQVPFKKHRLLVIETWKFKGLFRFAETSCGGTAQSCHQTVFVNE